MDYSTGKKMGRGPKFITCYICSRGFGTASLEIHQKTCKKMFLAEQAKLPAHKRKPLPEPPSEEQLAAMKAGDRKTLDEMNEEAWRRSQSLLEACPHCGRTFNPDRLPIHLRSCRPGNEAKKVGTPGLGGAGAPMHPAIQARSGHTEGESLAHTAPGSSGKKAGRRRSTNSPSERPRSAPRKPSETTRAIRSPRTPDAGTLPDVGTGRPPSASRAEISMSSTTAHYHGVGSGNARMISSLQHHVVALEGQIAHMQDELTSMKSLLLALQEQEKAATS